MTSASLPGVAQFDKGGTLLTYFPPSVDAITQLFNCPTDLADGRPVHYGKLMVAERNFTYSFNAKLDWCFFSNAYAHTYTSGSGTHNTPAIKGSQVKHPAQKILIFEEAYPNDGMCELIGAGGTPDPDDIETNRHDNYGNVCFADGHIDRVTPADVMAHATTNSSGILKLDEWYDLFKIISEFCCNICSE
jgi:prepilin-type processing-associated H-X9-DG protein